MRAAGQDSPTNGRESAIDLGPRYEHIRELGKGGSGRVFLVRDLYREAEVALKLLHWPLAGGEELEQVQKEFELLCRIEHPGIARAHDFGYLERRPFFTREFISGDPIDTTPLPDGDPGVLLEQARDLAAAVAFLHESGILHLDIKPSNIIVSRLPERPGPVLIDFGLMRRGLRGKGEVRVKGSLPYMGPEYFRGGAIGPWTDVYAIGVTLYRLSTGRFPRAGARAVVGRAGVKGAWDALVPPPSSSSSRIPPDLESAILKCLALDPDARFRDARQLSSILDHLTGKTSVRPFIPRVVRTVGRDAELAQIDRFLERLAAAPRGGLEDRGSPALIVTGSSGMGQTHIFREIKVRAQTRGPRLYHETGYAGRTTPPGSLLRSLANHVDEPTRSRFESFLSRLARPRTALRDETLEEERRLRWAGEIGLAAQAVREPWVLAVDGLQFFDEVSVLLLLDLVTLLRERSPTPALGIIAGYREEGPSARWLRELSMRALEAEGQSVIALRPLTPAETLDLHHQAAGGDWSKGSPSPDLGLFQETGGSPARILELVSGRQVMEKERNPGAARDDSSALGKEERSVDLTLRLLERPAPAAELAAILRTPRARIRRLLETLETAGIATQVGEGPEGAAWISAAPAVWTSPRDGAHERRRTHLRIARMLVRTAGPRTVFRLVEAVRHFLKAGDRAAVVKHGLAATRYLRSTFQSRAALDLCRVVLDAMPDAMSPPRLEVLFELAEIQARVGELDDGIRLLGEAIAASARLSSTWRSRVLLHLATLHSRRGDFQRAESLFRRGLKAGGAVKGRLSRYEHLRFLNEHAAMKAFTGDYAGALDLSAKGLSLAGRGRGTREMVSNLHATRGTVALRNFRFDEAARSFETALEVAESIGSVANNAVILNNLGIVYSQSDRCQESVRAFEEAEKACLRIDEGPSLVFIHGSLAVLHAKLGDHDAMERALAAATRLSTGGIAGPSRSRPGPTGAHQGTSPSLAAGAPGQETAAAHAGRRQEVFLEHHRGLALLHCGRYEEARPCFEAAISMGAASGDRVLAAFDRVYLAEALLFLGEYAEAGSALRKLSAAGQVPARVRKMALSRLALLSALSCQGREAGAAIVERMRIEDSPAVPFLDAVDDLFTGWALSIGGSSVRAADLFSRAGAYFRKHSFLPLLSLVRWTQAESHLLCGDLEAARRILEEAMDRPSVLVSALRPLLLARVLLESAADPGQLERAADLLAEAGAGLIGNALPEWKLRLKALRALCGSDGSGTRRALTEVGRERRQIVRELPLSARRQYLEGKHWKRWVLGSRGARRARLLDSGRADAAEPAYAPLPERGPDDSSGTATVSMRSRGTGGGGTLVIQSPGMRRLRETLDRLKDSDLPVVIHGEIGTGKEVVARTIHAESRRFGGPFLVVDFATVPSGLIEVELFGARAGAFTDLVTDRAGILKLADGGTVLFDEIAGASPEVQAKLLRALAEGRIRPVGSDEEVRADVRFLFSTSRDLEAEARAGRFREDLLYRIKVITVEVPPLRERREDLPALVDLFLGEGSGLAPSVAPRALERLREMAWPGNVRELKNVISRLTLEDDRHISAESLDREVRESERTLFPPGLFAEKSLEDLKNVLEREYLGHLLQRLGGDTTAASRLLGVTRKHFYRRCRQVGLRLKGKRPVDRP
ncbi:MAG TPA: sigma 54-interacting transcriptional regulator [Planctomycetota bacterium]|nr:sigma 54-interacting transcriptional regulator [Planctomycetota bacterium]